MRAPRLSVGSATTSALILSFAWSMGALAAVPAGYKGTPYMGTPQAIPGRVELANLDVGGEGVSYHADHRRANAKAEGYSPLSGDDYRPTELDLPDICSTNVKPPPDTWDKANGLPYPTAAKEHWYYMGLAHAVDWVKVTVDVKKAGKYWMSSNWASPNSTMHFQVYFNDGSMPAAAGDTKLDGVMKADCNLGAGTGDYHIWKAYPHFAMVDLSEGVQVMTFHLRTDHLQYGFIQFDPVDGEGADGGVAGAAGTSGAAGGNGAAGTSGAAGAAGAAGTSGAAGEPANPETGAAGTSAAAGVSGAAGEPNPETGAAGTGAPITGAAGTSGAAGSKGVSGGNGGGGCACSTASSPAGACSLILLGLALVVRRRRS
jgi:MYXO-CTERM domain-containing protein